MSGTPTTTSYAIPAFGTAQLNDVAATAGNFTSATLTGDNGIAITLDTPVTPPVNCSFALQGSVSQQSLQALAWLTGNNGNFNTAFADVPNIAPFDSTMTATVTLAGSTSGGAIVSVSLTIAATGGDASFNLVSGGLSLSGATAALFASAVSNAAGTTTRATAGWSLAGTVPVVSSQTTYALPVTIMPSRSQVWTLTASDTSLSTILGSDTNAANDVAEALISGSSADMQTALSTVTIGSLAWSPVAICAEISSSAVESAVVTLAGASNGATVCMAAATLSSTVDVAILSPPVLKNPNGASTAASPSVSNVMPSGFETPAGLDAGNFTSMDIATLVVKTKPAKHTKFIQFDIAGTMSLNGGTMQLENFSFTYVSNGTTTLQTYTGLLGTSAVQLSLFVTNNAAGAGWNGWIVADLTGAAVDLSTLFNLPSALAPFYLTTISLNGTFGAATGDYFYAGLGAASSTNPQPGDVSYLGLYLAPPPQPQGSGVTLVAYGPFGFTADVGTIATNISGCYVYCANQRITTAPLAPELSYVSNIGGFALVAGNITFTGTGGSTSIWRQPQNTALHRRLGDNGPPINLPNAGPNNVTPPQLPQANPAGVVQQTAQNGFFLGSLSASYSGGAISATATAGFNIGIVSASVLNLKLGYSLEGGGFSYDLGGFAVSLTRNKKVLGSGMFLETTSDGSPVYAGSLAIGNGTETLLVSGVILSDLGSSAAPYSAGFGFAMVDGLSWTMGGFLVQAVALGGGVNMTLEVPALAAIGEFPLITALSGNSTVLTSTTSAATAYSSCFEDMVTPADGAGNVLAGISGTTAGGIEITAIADVQWGGSFAINILGEAAYTQPHHPAPNTTPMTNVQLGVEGAFNPDEGLISITAQIIPGSYLFSNPGSNGTPGRSCTLTGGAALCLWYSGANSGDWVVSLGGYATSFNAPGYYPVVPRIGITWALASGSFNLTGQCYLTVCSAAFMAGLDVTASTSGGVSHLQFSASLSFTMDVMIGFAPFSYDFDIAIQLSGTFTVSYPIIHFSVQISLGAELNLQGEPFQGSWSVSFHGISATGTFGDTSQSPPPLLVWSEVTGDSSAPDSIEQSFLLQSTSGSPIPVSIAINSGLSAGSATSDGAGQIVDPTDVAFTVTSQIPVYEVQLLGNPVTITPPPASNFIVVPMTPPLSSSPAPNAVEVLGTSLLSIAITTQTGSIDASDFDGVAVIGGVPSALWAIAGSSNTVTQTLTGLSVGTVVTLQSKTDFMPLTNVMALEIVPRTASWDMAPVPTSDTFTNSADSYLAAIAAAPAANARATMVAAFAALGLPVGAAPISFADFAPDDIYTPLLRSIGEIKAATS